MSLRLLTTLAVLAALALPAATPAEAAPAVKLGIEVLQARHASLLKGQRVGLVTRVVPDPLAEALAFGDDLAKRSAAAVAVARRALREAGGPGFSERLARAEALYREELLVTEDAAEGVRAFLEKRAPRWRHR